MPFTPSQKLGFMALFLAVGSSNPIAIKYALNQDWGPFILGTMRSVFIGLFFAFWAWLVWKNPIGPNKIARINTIIASLCKGAGVVCFYIALWFLPANRVVMISTFSPIAGLLLIHIILKQDPVERRHALGVGISFLGISALLSPSNPGVEGYLPFFGETFVGDLIMMVSVFFHNAMVIFEKKALNAGANPRQLIIGANVISFLVFMAFFVLSAEKFRDIPTGSNAIYAFIYLISIAGVFHFYYRRWLVSKMEVTYINSFSHLGKAISIYYAVIILGETVSLTSIICFLIILLGVWVSTGEEGPRRLNYTDG